MITPQSYKWFFETTTPVEGHMHAIVRTVASLQTKFQMAEIMESASYGKVLVLDGRIQSSQGDEFIYHDALVHPGMLTTEAPPRSALVGAARPARISLAMSRDRAASSFAPLRRCSVSFT